jgi:hypothetical protein
LADRQAEDVGGLGKSEFVDGDIVGSLRDVGEREVLKRIWLENFAAALFACEEK